MAKKRAPQAARQGTRVEQNQGAARPTRPRRRRLPDRLEAIWRTGRLLNCMTFHAKQAFLLSNRCEYRKTYRLWDRLALMVREISESIEERDAISGEVRRAKEQFQTYCGAGVDPERLYAANAQLEEWDRTQPGASLVGMVDDVCEGLLTQVVGCLSGDALA